MTGEGIDMGQLDNVIKDRPADYSNLLWMGSRLHYYRVLNELSPSMVPKLPN